MVSGLPVLSETNGRLELKTYDGLGRLTSISRDGYGPPAWLSIVDYPYGPCACSPTGKLKRVSRPHAQGETTVRATYTYDARGRATHVEQPGGTGATSYVYRGNTVQVTGPSCKWKICTLDAFGNLIQVTEPDTLSDGADEIYHSYTLFDKLKQNYQVAHLAARMNAPKAAGLLVELNAEAEQVEEAGWKETL